MVCSNLERAKISYFRQTIRHDIVETKPNFDFNTSSERPFSKLSENHKGTFANEPNQVT